MIDRSMPSSKAQQLDKNSSTNNEFLFTYTKGIDEKQLYKDISTRLIALETSLEIN
ncbi:hypothetical protein [Metabacillus fastidiosus]|uniref:hypothetical protein n=1 Tax=Metabacillus fastidiosus TaxID=1458 RepID=UPI002E2296FA|nr:hypothetical protein [Metabacillus fastidiosus]